jgi:hypothetical protein
VSQIMKTQSVLRPQLRQPSVIEGLTPDPTEVAGIEWATGPIGTAWGGQARGPARRDAAPCWPAARGRLRLGQEPPAGASGAVRAGRWIRGRHGPALVEAAASLDPGTPAHAELWRWVGAQGAGLNERFTATLLLFDWLGATGGELADAIVRFWSGDPIKVAEVRRRLRETGEARYPLPAVPARELARQRFRFAARLMVAAGYAGWLILFDEVELIGRCSVLQRGRSYAELAHWVRGAHDDPGLPLVAVLAMTDDFEAADLLAMAVLRTPSSSLSRSAVRCGD